jgi:deoxyuridine 5'-triphosphate nucleotidohydrolase
MVDLNFNLEYAKEGDVGLDLPVAMIKGDEKFKITPHNDYLINWEERWFDIPAKGMAEIPCGLSVKVPDDAWGNIKPRSSTPWKRRLHVSEGVIDSGYTGPLYILVNNPNNEPSRIKEMDRLAQLIIVPKYRSYHVDAGGAVCGHSEIAIEKSSDLPSTERGDTGFGSSGGVQGE